MDPFHICICTKFGRQESNILHSSQSFEKLSFAQWITPYINSELYEVPGSNPITTADVPLGKTLYPFCLVLRTGLKTSVP